MSDDTNAHLKTGDGLLTLDAAGRPPKSRLDDAASVLAVVEQHRKASEERNAKAANIKGMFDGNPPFNPGKLRTNNMAYYPNFNTLEGKAYASSAKVPYYDLFSGGTTYVEVSLELPTDDTGGDTEANASRIVTEELDRTLRDHVAFETTMWKLIDDFVKFGKGYLMWPDATDWRFKRIAWHRVRFPNDTDVDMDEWESFSVVRHYTVHELYNRIRNRQRAEAAGWNVDNVIEAIRTACRIKPEDVNDWIGVQQQLRDYDLAVDARSDRVETATLYVREFDGRWSQFIVLTGATLTAQRTGVAKAKTGFLYRRVGLYERVNHIIAPFFFDVDDGSINGLSGLGKDIYAPMQLKDRMRCAQVNNVFLRSCVLMQARTASARQKAALSMIGPTAVIAEGYDIQQSTVLGDIESTVVVNADIDRMLQANTGIYRPQFEKPPGNPETATGATLRFTQGTVLTNSAVNRFHAQLDRAYAELYRRLVKSGETQARTFRKWCNERGVTNEMLPKVRSVRSYRNIGNGSAFLRQNNIAALMPMYAELPEDGKQRFIEDVVSAYTNQQKVERYTQTPMRKNIPTRHLWEASVENDSLAHGAPVVWTPEQNDIVHLTAHAAAVQQALAGVEGGADPAGVAVFAQAAVAHAVTAHIASLQRKGRKADVKQWMEVFKELGAAAMALAQQVQQQTQDAASQRQATAEAMSDQQLKQAEAAGKMQLAGAKTEHQMQLREAAAMQKLRINDTMAASKIINAARTADNGDGE